MRSEQFYAWAIPHGDYLFYGDPVQLFRTRMEARKVSSFNGFYDPVKVVVTVEQEMKTCPQTPLPESAKV
jgi:hypothetical protein